MNIDSIAKHARDINAALFHAFGQDDKAGWDNSTGAQKYSKVDDVVFHLNHRQAMSDAVAAAKADAASKGLVYGSVDFPKLPPDTPEFAFERFLEYQAANGWTHGDFDLEAKKHPFMVPYAKLPVEQKAKFCVFWALVNGLATYLPSDALDAN